MTAFDDALKAYADLRVQGYPGAHIWTVDVFTALSDLGYTDEEWVRRIEERFDKCWMEAMGDFTDFLEITEECEDRPYDPSKQRKGDETKAA